MTPQPVPIQRPRLELHFPILALASPGPGGRGVSCFHERPHCGHHQDQIFWTHDPVGTKQTGVGIPEDAVHLFTPSEYAVFLRPAHLPPLSG